MSSFRPSHTFSCSTSPFPECEESLHVSRISQSYGWPNPTPSRALVASERIQSPLPYDLPSSLTAETSLLEESPPANGLLWEQSNNVSPQDYLLDDPEYGWTSTLLSNLGWGNQFEPNFPLPTASSSQILATQDNRAYIHSASRDECPLFPPELFSRGLETNILPGPSFPNQQTPLSRTDLAQVFPTNFRLLEWVCHIAKQQWFAANEMEPLLKQEERELLKNLGLITDIQSRFEIFTSRDSGYQCLWGEGENQCTHKSSRRLRALGHIHGHLGYRPYRCAGRCGRIGCTDCHSSPSALDEHIRRNQKPRRTCSICCRSVTAQNLSRHMKGHALAGRDGRPLFRPQKADQCLTADFEHGFYAIDLPSNRS